MKSLMISTCTAALVFAGPAIADELQEKNLIQLSSTQMDSVTAGFTISANDMTLFTGSCGAAGGTACNQGQPDENFPSFSAGEAGALFGAWNAHVHSDQITHP